MCVLAGTIVQGAVAAVPGARMVDAHGHRIRIRIRIRMDGGWRAWGVGVDLLLVPAGSVHTVAVINAYVRAPVTPLVDYGASLLAARRLAELLRGHDAGPLRASA
jgi:hypothetical protein